MIHIIGFIFICCLMGYVCKQFPVEAYKVSRIIKWILIGLAVCFLSMGALIEYRHAEFQKFENSQKISGEAEFIESLDN